MRQNACPACNGENPSHNLWCRTCGERIQFRCRHCRGVHRLDAEICGRTGRSIPSAWKLTVETSLRAFYGPLLDKLGRAPHRLVALTILLLTVSMLWRPPTRAFGGAPVNGHGTHGNAPQIDVVFLIDSTGSMQKEIDVVKDRVVSMMDELRKGQPTPYVRFGLVTYRDRGDEYVTKKFELTDDVKAMQRNIRDLVADGGGDILESVNEGLHVAVQGMNWDKRQGTSRIIFLIGDAGPHMDYANDYDYHNECAVARRNGIKINVIGCTGIWEAGLNDFQQIAALGRGDFNYLTYRQAVVLPDGRSGYELNEGGRVYSTSVTSDAWKAGAERAAARDARDYAAAPPTAAPALAKCRADNNLETVMTEAVKKEAAASGVRY